MKYLHLFVLKVTLFFILFLLNSSVSFGESFLQSFHSNSEVQKEKLKCWLKGNSESYKKVPLRPDAIPCKVINFDGKSDVTLKVKCGENEGHINKTTPLLGLSVDLYMGSKKTQTIILDDIPEGKNIFRSYLHPRNSLTDSPHHQWVMEKIRKGNKILFNKARFSPTPYIIDIDTPMHSKSISAYEEAEKRTSMTVGTGQTEKTVCTKKLECIKKNRAGTLDVTVTCLEKKSSQCPSANECISQKLIKETSHNGRFYSFVEEEAPTTPDKPRIIPAEEIARKLLGQGSNQ